LLTRLALPLAPATVERPELLAGDGEAAALADGLAPPEALAEADADGVADALARLAVSV
jgi:hypothetical protein